MKSLYIPLYTKKNCMNLNKILSLFLLCASVSACCPTTRFSWKEPNPNPKLIEYNKRFGPEIATYKQRETSKIGKKCGIAVDNIYRTDLITGEKQNFVRISATTIVPTRYYESGSGLLTVKEVSALITSIEGMLDARENSKPNTICELVYTTDSGFRVYTFYTPESRRWTTSIEPDINKTRLYMKAITLKTLKRLHEFLKTAQDRYVK